MTKGVPEELQIAYNHNPQQYDLLGVMADAADEAGKYEVGECLRFLWKHRQVPEKPYDSFGWFGWQGNSPALPFLKEMPAIGVADSPIEAIERVLVTWPQHKNLLINALETQ